VSIPIFRRIFRIRCLVFSILALAGFAFAEDRYSPAAMKTISSAYALGDRQKIVAAMVSGAAQTSVPSDKKAILTSLADYEERSGSLTDAAKHFNDAAFSDPKSRDDGLLLDSARCLVAAGDSSGADALVRAVLLTCFDDSLLSRARVYSAWIALSDAGSDAAASSLALMKTYAYNPSFSAWAPSLLFTIWWASGDEASRDSLLTSFPKSPESAILRGEIRLSAAPFWYLMGRDAQGVAEFARRGSADLGQAAALVASTDVAAAPKTQPSAQTAASGDDSSPRGDDLASSSASAEIAQGRWQQTGFFRNREYAEDLRDRLGEAGFTAVIREEKRPSGTIYFSVLVPENADRSVGSRLKDAGFESYFVGD